MKKIMQALLLLLDGALLLADEIEAESSGWNDEAVETYNKMLDDLQNARVRIKKLI